MMPYVANKKKIGGIVYASEVAIKWERTVYDNEDDGLDTGVELSGTFALCGKQLEEFRAKLQALIEEYRI